MWTSGELKERAKIALTGTYWKAFAISLMLSFASGGGSGSGFRLNNFGKKNSTTGSMGDIGTETIITFAIIFIGIFMVILVFALLFGIFVSAPLTVGVRKYFLEAAEAVNTGIKAEFNLVGHGFKSGHYMNVIKTMFLKGLYTFLWSLLFIIPGIIKGYAYAMVPYILADNPNIGTKRAIELSCRMTDGEKLDMFVLDLSFIGWFLLGVIACGIGVLFVNPYYNSTHAELYRTLREKAFEENMCSFEELGFTGEE